MKDMRYFQEHVSMAVEVEYEMGGRCWHTMKGSEVKNFCDRLDEDEYLSDIDYASKQPDEWVKKVLNTAWLNFSKNTEWRKSKNLTSLDAVVDYIIEHKLVA